MRSARKCGLRFRRTNGIHEEKTTQFYGLLSECFVGRLSTSPTEMESRVSGAFVAASPDSTNLSGG